MTLGAEGDFEIVGIAPPPTGDYVAVWVNDEGKYYTEPIVSTVVVREMLDNKESHDTVCLAYLDTLGLYQGIGCVVPCSHPWKITEDPHWVGLRDGVEDAVREVLEERRGRNRGGTAT